MIIFYPEILGMREELTVLESWQETDGTLKLGNLRSACLIVLFRVHSGKGELSTPGMKCFHSRMKGLPSH